MTQLSDMIIPTRETAIQTYFLHVYLNHESPVMFVGPTGTGKSAITNNHLVKMPKERYRNMMRSIGQNDL